MSQNRTKVCLIRASDQTMTNYREGFIALLAKDRLQRYELSDDPANSDVILMTDLAVWGVDDWWNIKSVANHPLVVNCCPRLFVYAELDSPYCMYQGLYCSMPKRYFNNDRQRAVAYYEMENKFVQQLSESSTSNPSEIYPEFLYSFMGGSTAPIRYEVLKLPTTRASIHDTTGYSIYNESDACNPERQKSYVECILKSKFVLCPRGKGTGSVRMFECLALGRVPVVISDQYVFPKGPEWEKCCIQVPEAAVSSIPDQLERMEPDWERMSKFAKKVYAEWFAEDILFHRMIEQCLDIVARKRIPERIWQLLPDKQRLVFRAKRWANMTKQMTMRH